MLIKLANFAGLVPKAGVRNLPDNHASVAKNTQLYSGEVRGLRNPLATADLSAEVFTVRRAYRLNDGSVSIADAVGDWVAFDDNAVNFVRGALKNDQYDRYYAAGGTQAPVVNSATDWAAGNTPWDLGVPAPVNTPTVTPPPSGTVDETRAYVYTFVNTWGEESGPSPNSIVATGDITGTWVIGNMSTAFSGTPSNPRPLSAIRIYRTVTGSRSVDYRFVAEITPAAVYNDSESADTISLNESLPTLQNNLPPSNLQGIVNMPNGIMVGFVGRDIYFSEPYQPHSWPFQYVRSVESPIVGIGVYQQGAVICTTSNPYICTGVSPDTMILSKLDDVEPCQSFRSILNGLDGVMYASQNGMVLVNQSGAFNVTQPLVTRNEWRSNYKPGTSQCATDGSRIVSFYSINEGWVFTPYEPLGHLVDLTGFTDVGSVQSDPFTGECYIISRDVVYLWNPETTIPLAYTWKSKVFELPYPVNMGAYRIQYEDVISGIDYVPGYDYTNYNSSRFDATTINATYSLPTVVFQNDWEGTNGATTDTEQSSNTALLTAFTGANISTARARFGSTSAFGGFFEAWWSAPDIAAYDMGSGSFTWETWINMRQLPAANGTEEWSMINQWGAGGNAYAFNFFRTAGGVFTIRVRLGATTIDVPVTGTTPVASISDPGTWYHVVAERIGDTVYVGFNGIVEGSGTFSGAVPTSTELLRFFDDGNLNWPSVMWMDDTRISVDAPQYRLDAGGTYSVPSTTLPAPSGGGSQTIVTHPLNTLNLYPINGVRREVGVTESPPVIQFKMPVAGSPLYSNTNLVVRDRINVKIYADGVLRYERDVSSQDVMRLPSGYKADKWQVELSTAQNIYSFKMAGTAKELAKS